MTDLFRNPAAAAKTIATLTLNPTIDTAFQAEEVHHTLKTRTFDEEVDPGGGGVNVARVLTRFGAHVTALFLAGGYTGRLLDELLGREAIDRARIDIEGDTRLSVTIFEQSTGLEYRFVPEGPMVTEAEWQPCLESVSACGCDYFVASGSLPRGVPEDFYARARARLPAGARFVLDTSGAELRNALRVGGIFLVKPSKAELEEYAGTELPDADALTAAATAIVDQKLAEHVAVTLGQDGAILVSPSGSECVAAPSVDSRSAVGAGDSFLAGLIYGLASGMEGPAALRLGIAAGAASTLNPGTSLCDPDDVERLFRKLQSEKADGR